MKLYTYLRALCAAALGLSLLVPMFAVAASPIDAALNSAAAVNASANAGVTAGGTSASVTLSAAVTTRAKTKADTEIDRRIKALGDLNTRVAAMTKVSADFKQNLATNIQTQITALSALKVKIDADTDGATLKADVQSIAAAYRVFILVMPQARIAASADREATIINMLVGIGSKLQARIQAAQTAGANVTALTAALTDMGTHLTGAQTEAQAAISGSATLTPDNGDKTVMASNTAALKASRDQITAAQKDLVAARKDVDTILKGLKSISASTSASSTVRTQ